MFRDTLKMLRHLEMAELRGRSPEPVSDPIGKRATSARRRGGIGRGKRIG